MKYDNFNLAATVHVQDPYCPKHGNKMIEMDDGWFKSAWWCTECKAPYTLAFVKMRKWNQEVVDKELVRQEKIRAQKQV